MGSGIASNIAGNKNEPNFRSRATGIATFFFYSMSKHGHVIDIDVDFESAIDRVTRALATESFDVLARIDFDELFREKLDADFRRYSMLWACDPQLARTALTADSDNSMMLPCKICVEETSIGSRVQIADPPMMSTAAGVDDNPEIQDLVKEASAQLARAAALIARHSGPD